MRTRNRRGPFGSPGACRGRILIIGQSDTRTQACDGPGPMSNSTANEHRSPSGRTVTGSAGRRAPATLECRTKAHDRPLRYGRCRTLESSFSHTRGDPDEEVRSLLDVGPHRRGRFRLQQWPRGRLASIPGSRLAGCLRRVEPADQMERQREHRLENEASRPRQFQPHHAGRQDLSDLLQRLRRRQNGSRRPSPT